MNEIDELINSLSLLPGIGAKSAERIAINLLSLPKDEREQFVNVFSTTLRDSRFCRLCKGISFTDVCDICSDNNRDDYLAVVTSQLDYMHLKRSNVFTGYFFVLNEEISPAKGSLGDDIDVESLIERASQFSEIILSTNATIEGELTSNFVYQKIKHLDLKVSRLGSGIPIGASINYVDPLTLKTAFDKREVKDE